MIDPDLATQTIRLALERGATDAECTLAEGEEFSALVRMRSLERLKDAGSRAAGLRVLVGQRVGSSYTSDLSAEGIRARRADRRSAVTLGGHPKHRHRLSHRTSAPNRRSRLHRRCAHHQL